MKITIFLATIVVFTILLNNQSFAVKFQDSNGYTPSWARSMGIYQVLNECGNLSPQDRDFDWCMEWMVYVLDQGIENFPKSAQGGMPNSGIVSEDFLEVGQSYTGPLEKFLPTSFSFGKGWEVSRPYTTSDELISQYGESGIIDFVSQRIIATDQSIVGDKNADPSKQILMSYGIIEFEDNDHANSFYESWASNINKAYILNPAIDAEETSSVKSEHFEEHFQKTVIRGEEYTTFKDFLRITDCYGYHKDYDKKNEEFHKTCIKGKYAILATAISTNGCCVDDPYWDYITPDIIADDFIGIISNRIDSVTQTNSKIYFSDEARSLAREYNLHKISDGEILNELQRMINDNKISFPVDGLNIDYNSERLGRIPDKANVAILSWGMGTLSDSYMAEELRWLVERRYLSHPNVPVSGYIGLNPEGETRQEHFFDMPLEENEAESNVKTEINAQSENNLPRYGDVEDSDVDPASVAIGVFVVFGIPAIIIWLIIRKIKQRRKNQSRYTQSRSGSLPKGF